MVRKLACIVTALVAVSTICCTTSGVSEALGQDLFYNYYVPPSGSGTLGAQLYVAPLPTPPLVGHTYVTYQPLMPHEFLYPHHRSYVNRHPDGSVTRTTVRWRPSLFELPHHHQVLPSPPPPHLLHPLEPWCYDR